MKDTNLTNCSEIEKKRARERALYILERRDHSKKELFDKVRRTNSESASLYAVERMEELGLVDDSTYARKLVKDLVDRKHLSGRRLKYEMHRKGIEDNLVEEVIDELEIDPVEQIRKIIVQKYQDHLEDDKKKRRAVAALQRMGYSWDDIKTAIHMECD